MTAFPIADCAPAPRQVPVRPSPTYSGTVPFFNEEANVHSLLGELRRALDALPDAYEVILVDDGSTDGTVATLNAGAAEWPKCTILAFEQNRGQAAALLSAFARAKGDLFVTLDGDGQNDPAVIPMLLGRLDGADMVIGVRAQRQHSSDAA